MAHVAYRDNATGGGNRIQYLADMITLSRMAFAAGMLVTEPFSAAFWTCYVCGGLSDLLDGPVARLLNRQSERGARLDSAADLVFAAAIAVFVFINIRLPLWVWLCALAAALLRVTGYIVGFRKYRAFSALHTYLNKAAGALVFAFPLLHALLGLHLAAGITCFTAILSAAEEAAITLRSPKLNRDCKGAFVYK